MSHLGEGVSLGRGLRGYSAFPPTKMLALLAAATVTSAVKVNDSGSNALGCLGAVGTSVRVVVLQVGHAPVGRSLLSCALNR